MSRNCSVQLQKKLFRRLDSREETLDMSRTRNGFLQKSYKYQQKSHMHQQKSPVFCRTAAHGITLCNTATYCNTLCKAHISQRALYIRQKRHFRNSDSEVRQAGLVQALHLRKRALCICKRAVCICKRALCSSKRALRLCQRALYLCRCEALVCVLNT